MQGLAEPLAGFLPLGILQRIHGADGGRPAAVEFSGAVLLVDVSRYTSLVERYAQRGQQGLERIPDLLGRAHTRCVEHVYELGGEVLQLAGDAILACWPDDGGGLHGAVSAATSCAESLCGSTRSSDLLVGPVGEAVPTLHAGIGAGRIWAAALGGHPNWCLLVGGEAVRQAAAAVAQARPREYRISAEATRVVDALRGAAAAPMPAVATVAEADWLAGFLPVELRTANLRPHIPRDSAMTLLADFSMGFDALAEIRPVTVLFARITGLEDGPHALADYQSLCAALQEDLRRYDGPPGELLFDDKGLVFIAVFGAFGRFHRDDASRALEATRAISATTRRLGCAASIGVSTGDAVFRVVGGARRRQLMVLGAPMNRAARLMTSVTDGVLCDAPTERSSRRRFHFEERGTLQLEGLGDTAAVFSPVAPRVAVAFRGSLIGRERELAILHRAFDEARAGLRRLVIVSGEPGIGKSHLVETFSEALDQGAVAMARVERNDRRSSLQPWRRALAALLQLGPDADGARIHAELTARFGDDPSIVSRLPLLDGMLALPLLQTDATRHLDGANRADAIMRLLGDLLGRLAPRPLALIVEDSQWLDSASWRLLEWVLTSVSSLLVVLCVRPEEAPEALKMLRQRAESARINAAGFESDDPARFCRILDLEELAESSLLAIVKQTLGGAPPHDELARRICELAGGNPFFAEEITLTLKSEGIVAVRDGSWRALRSLDGLQYFDGVERVIRERIDSLNALAQSILKAAAVIGRSFTRNALPPLLQGEVDAASVDSALESLEAAHLVRRTDEAGRYVFRHDQTRDVVYNSIPGDVRQRLHHALAEWIEGSATTTTAALALLVQHFHAAGNRDKAVRYGDLAATGALQTGAFREVEAFLDICLSYEPREPWDTGQLMQAVRWRRQLGETYYGLGDIKAQSSSVRRALTLAGCPVPDSGTSLAGRLVGGALRLLAQQLLPSAFGARDEAERSWEREIARCLSQAAVVDYFELRIVRAFCLAISAVTHAERAGLSIESILASAQLACALGILGRGRVSGHFMSRAERGAIALGDPTVRAQVCYLDALWRVGHCEWAAVDRRLDQSQALCLTAGDQLSWCNAQAIRFWSLYYRGDQGPLERTAQGLLSRAQNSGNLQQEIWALRCKSLCVLQSDSPREAVDLLRLTTATLPGSADLSEHVASTGVLALALGRVGLHTDSVEAAIATLRMLKRMRKPTVHSTLPGICGIAEVLFRGREAGISREYAEWPRWERQVLRELDRYRRVFPVGGPQYGLWSGVNDWLDGRHDRAVSTWKRAVAVARRLSLRRDEAMITAELRRSDVRP